MTITPPKTNDKLTLALAGRLDTTTAPRLEKAVFEQHDDVSALELDCAKLEYISSAGLRVFLAAKKKMDAVKAS
ncbi:MAG: STAS domain-containing protein [Eubacterium sp.]